MRFLSFKEFVKLPPGTVYSYYKPVLCEGLFVKGPTIDHDGTPSDFFESSVVAWSYMGFEPAVDPTPGRWALYDHEQQFAVYEAEDLEIMREMLSGVFDILADEGRPPAG